MAIINQLRGVQAVLANLRARNVALAVGFQRGIVVAGLTLQRESQRLVPVDYGLLKSSAFTRSTGAGFSTVVTIGYTAAYALYVHELVGMKLKGQPRPGGRGKYWDPQGRAQAKFLEEPFRRLQPQFAEIVKRYMRIT
jgi:hypothetical protein